MTVSEPGALHRGESVEVGSRGCRVVLDLRPQPGTVLHVRLTHSLAGPVELGATVVWASATLPWTHGLAYSAPWIDRAERWFDALTAACPELLTHGLVPDRIGPDAHLVADPLQAATLGAREVAVLSHARHGATVRELQARLEGSWSESKRVLLGLIDRGALTIERGGWDEAAMELGEPALDGRGLGARRRS